MNNLKRIHNYPRYDEDGKLTGAFIIVTNDTNNDQFSAVVSGDFRQATEEECIAAVLDSVFKRYFADRAMSEAVQTVDELKRQSASFEKSIKDAKEWINSVNTEIETLKQEALAEIRATTEQNQEMTKLSTMMLNDVLEQLEELLAQKEGNHDDVIGNAEETDRGGTTDE